MYWYQSHDLDRKWLIQYHKHNTTFTTPLSVYFYKVCGDQTSKSQPILFILKSNQICELLQCRYTSMFLSICWKLTVVLLYSKLTYTYRLKRLQGLNVNFTCIMYLTYVHAQLNYACKIWLNNNLHPLYLFS